MTLFNNKQKLHNLLKTDAGRSIAMQVTFLNTLRQKLKNTQGNIAHDDVYFKEIEEDIKKIDTYTAALEQQVFTPSKH